MAAVTPLLPCFSSSSFPMFAFHVPTPPLNSSYMCLRSRRTRTISSSLVSTGTATAKRNKVCRAAATTAHKYVKEDYLVKKMSAAEIQELVKGDRSVPLIIDFYTTWCGPCVLMAQELEMLAVEYESSALFVKVDTDNEYEFARDMQVRGLPTLYFISPDSSKDAIRTEGLIPTQMMRDIIDNDM